VDELVIGTQGPLPESLSARLRTGLPPEELLAGTLPDAAASTLTPRHDVLDGVTAGELDRLFGPETAARIWTADSGVWVGPHHTVRGQHWFRVTGRTSGEPAPLGLVREQVRLDWIAENEEARLEERVKALRERYSVVFTDEEGGP
jgi:hypothetical protein